MIAPSPQFAYANSDSNLQQLKLGHVFVRREFEEEDEDISVTPRDNRHGWFHARFGRF